MRAYGFSRYGNGWLVYDHECYIIEREQRGLGWTHKELSRLSRHRSYKRVERRRAKEEIKKEEEEALQDR